MCCFWQLVPVSLANILCSKAWCFLTQKPTSNSQFFRFTSGFFGRLGIRLEKGSQDGIRAPSGDSGFHVIFHHFSPCTLGVSYPALPGAKKTTGSTITTLLGGTYHSPAARTWNLPGGFCMCGSPAWSWGRKHQKQNESTAQTAWNSLQHQHVNPGSNSVYGVHKSAPTCGSALLPPSQDLTSP